MGHLQIRDLDDDLHDRLRERAAAAHLSMRDYVLRLIEADLALPTVDEWLDKVAERPIIDDDIDTAALIREERELRTTQILAAAEERATYADGR